MRLSGRLPARQAALLALALWACKEERAAPVSAAGPRGGVGPAASPALSDKLEHEARHRPAGAVTAEQVYAALEKAGLPLTERRQHHASPFGAAYCLEAKGPWGTSFSVCEYESEAAAAAGAREAETGLGSVSGRTVARKAQTVLTVREPDPATARSAEVSQTAVAEFLAR